jgi:hypothetical protein
MADEQEQIIEFHSRYKDESPRPFPASKAIPDWMRKLPPNLPLELTGGVKTGTVKQCKPFLDAMTCGYAIPFTHDAHFYLRDPHHLEWATSGTTIGTQMHEQVAATPMAGYPLVKFMNPWVIKTPPGYSTIFLPMLNHFAIPFQILAGIVETDIYYDLVHFPAVCMMKPGDRFFLAKGTPIVQAIPIKRESWKAESHTWDLPRVEAVEKVRETSPHDYRDTYWRRKEYR